MKCTSLLLCIVIAISMTVDARLTIRHRRQVEREEATSGSSSSELPASEVVVIKDTINPSLPGPLFLVPRLPGPGDAFDLDINEQDGTFSFGGQLPSHFHHHHDVGHQSFAGLFDAIQRRFDEMTRNMMSFNNFGPGFSPTTDISTLPDDYNKTDSEIVELNGHRYVKKTTTLKKGGPGATFFVRSTTFERVNENENADVPAPEEESDKKDKPVVIGGGPEDGVKVEESVPVPSNSSEDGTSLTSAPSSPSSSSTSTEAPVAESSPDVPAASDLDSSAAAAEDAKDKPSTNNESNESDEREREGESLSSSSSTTEQP